MSRPLLAKPVAQFGEQTTLFSMLAAAVTAVAFLSCSLPGPKGQCGLREIGSLGWCLGSLGDLEQSGDSTSPSQPQRS